MVVSLEPSMTADTRPARLSTPQLSIIVLKNAIAPEPDSGRRIISGIAASGRFISLANGRSAKEDISDAPEDVKMLIIKNSAHSVGRMDITVPIPSRAPSINASNTFTRFTAPVIMITAISTGIM